MRCVAIAAGLCLAPPWAGDLPEVKAKGVLRLIAQKDGAGWW